MIRLSKLDKTQIVVNLDSIKYIESTPDTLIFFLNGESLIVLEPLDEVVNRVVEYKTRVLKTIKSA